MQTYDTKPRRRLFEVLRSQGMQAGQQVTFLTDGGEDIRDIPCYPNAQAGVATGKGVQLVLQQPRRDHEITFALQRITGDRARALVFPGETEITNDFPGPVPRRPAHRRPRKGCGKAKPRMACRFTGPGWPWAPGDPGPASH